MCCVGFIAAANGVIGAEASRVHKLNRAIVTEANLRYYAYLQILSPVA